jgi:hypothetical protein
MLASTFALKPDNDAALRHYRAARDILASHGKALRERSAAAPGGPDSMDARDANREAAEVEGLAVELAQTVRLLVRFLLKWLLIEEDRSTR